MSAPCRSVQPARGLWPLCPLTAARLRGETAEAIPSNPLEGRLMKLHRLVPLALAVRRRPARRRLRRRLRYDHDRTDRARRNGRRPPHRPRQGGRLGGRRAHLRQPGLRLGEQEAGRDRQRHLHPHRRRQGVGVHLDRVALRRPDHRRGPLLRRERLDARDHRRDRRIRRAPAVRCSFTRATRKKRSTTSPTKSKSRPAAPPQRALARRTSRACCRGS